MRVRKTSDRGVVEVSSSSRRRLWHRVDLEEMTCTCEGAMDFAKASQGPCKHIEAAIVARSRPTPPRPPCGSLFTLFKEVKPMTPRRRKPGINYSPALCFPSAGLSLLRIA
jgi:hypothetical protein